MKLLTRSTGRPKRLFVPINEFEFNSFGVRVMSLAMGEPKAPRVDFRRTRPYSRSLWAMSPVP